MTATERTRAALPSFGDGDWRDRMARFGLLGKGVVHAVVGILALELALSGGSSEDASTSGAADWFADRPFGTLALWLMAASLLALAAWRATTTVDGDPVEDDDGWQRLVWAGKTVVYGALAVTFATVALRGSGSSGSSDDEQASEAAGTVLEWPMGRWLVAAAGVVVIGVALYLVYDHGIRATFARRLAVDDDSAVVQVGRVGYGLRSIAWVLVGAVLVDAGLAGEEQRAEGMSGALERLAEATWGTAVLIGVAIGFLAFGLYSVAEARYRRAA